MVPEETQEEASDCLPNAQSKSGITQLDGLKENQSTDQVCDEVMLPAPDEDVSSRTPEMSQQCVNLEQVSCTELNVVEALIREANNRTSHDADAILDQEITEELAFLFPDPASTLEIHGSARSDQGAQGSCSLPSSSVLSQNSTTAVEFGPQVEQMTFRAASSEVVHEGGVQPPNISYGGSMIQNPQMQFPLFSDPFENELEKLRREKENLRKNFEKARSELNVELERKMAEARNEFDRKSQEVDAAYNAKAMEEEAIRSSVAMSSLLANAFTYKCTEKCAATDVEAVRARSFHHPIQQQQPVQTNTDMNSTAPPRPSVMAAEAPIPNPSGLLSHFPRCNTTQSTPASQQAAVQSNTPMNSTAPQPSVTSAEAPIPIPSGPLSHLPHRNSTQPRPLSQQVAVQSNTHMNSTALPRPSVTAEVLPLHSPLYNTPQPRPPPLIANLTPSSSPSVHGIKRAPAPHLQSFRASRAPNSAAASTTYPRRLVQEQQQHQQQVKSNDDVVCLSDDDE